MSEILNGEIILNDNEQKLVKFSNKTYKISPNNEILDLNYGTNVKFSLEKRIFSDKTEIFARVHSVNDENWDKIYQNFIKNGKNYSISEYHEFLKSNYTNPSKK